MVVKIAKKLGFSGFKDFRAGIVDYNRLPTAELHQETVARRHRRGDRAEGVPHLDPCA